MGKGRVMVIDQRRLVAVVVTYNRLAKLQATLAALLENPTEHLAMVVVVDNASTDGTAAWLKTQTDPRLDCQLLPDNRGGAGGFAAGMLRAMDDHAPDWVVVMDDDARPQSGALAAFHQTDLSEWDALAAAVYFPDGRICEMNRPSRNPFWHMRVFLRTLFRLGGRSGFHLDPSAYAEDAPARQVDITSFVGFFISAAAIARMGYPDPALFVYGDDGIYSLRLSQRGGRIGFMPQIKFDHDCSTFAVDDGRFQPLWKVYYYHRNLLILYRMAAGWLFWPALLVVLPKWLLKTRYHRGEKQAFLRLLFYGIGHGFRRKTNVAHQDVLAMIQPK